MYERILLPTDGSDTAELATDRAIEMANRYNAVLHVLYVVERSREDPVQKGLKEKLSEELGDGKTVVSAVEKRAAKVDIETVTTIQPGVPRTTIEDYASEHDIGLIVLGSRGASDMTEKFLGTVAKYVVNEAPADVFIVRPDAHLES